MEKIIFKIQFSLNLIQFYYAVCGILAHQNAPCESTSTMTSLYCTQL